MCISELIDCVQSTSSLIINTAGRFFLLENLLTPYFDHTASQAIGTEMHAYTIGNVHAIELRSSKNNEQNLRGIITLLSSFLAFIHNRRQFVYSLIQVAKSCVDSCTVT